MVQARTNKLYTHTSCGGEIEIIKFRESFRDLVRCTKCGESWKEAISDQPTK